MKKPTLQSFLKWLFIKVPIVTLILFLAMAGSLKLVERYPNPLKQGLEDFLSQRTSTNASIEIVETIKFFPDIIIDLRDIKLHNRVNAAIVDLNIAHFVAKAPLWSVFINAGYLTHLDIEDLTSASGFIAPHKIQADNISLLSHDGPEQYGHFLQVTGRYDSKPLSLEVKIDKKGKNYKIPANMPFSLQIGNTNLNATIYRTGRDMQMGNILINGKKPTKDRYIIVKDGVYQSNHPLACLLESAQINTCQDFLNP